MSVARFEAANVAEGNGTWLPGSALSFQTVPLNTLSRVPPLFDVRVTIVPAGDLIVIWSWPQEVCVMEVATSRSYRYVPTPETVTVEVTVGVPVVAMTFGTSVLTQVEGVTGICGGHWHRPPTQTSTVQALPSVHEFVSSGV